MLEIHENEIVYYKQRDKILYFVLAFMSILAVIFVFEILLASIVYGLARWILMLISEVLALIFIYKKYKSFDYGKGNFTGKKIFELNQAGIFYGGRSHSWDDMVDFQVVEYDVDDEGSKRLRPLIKMFYKGKKKENLILYDVVLDDYGEFARKSYEMFKRFKPDLDTADLNKKEEKKDLFSGDSFEVYADECIDYYGWKLDSRRNDNLYDLKLVNLGEQKEEERKDRGRILKNILIQILLIVLILGPIFLSTIDIERLDISNSAKTIIKLFKYGAIPSLVLFVVVVIINGIRNNNKYKTFIERNPLLFSVKANRIVAVSRKNDIELKYIDKADVMELSLEPNTEIEQKVYGSIVPRYLLNVKNQNGVNIKLELPNWLEDEKSIDELQAVLDRNYKVRKS